MKKENPHKLSRRRSEQPGYTSAVYLTDKIGDYIRIDYNLGKKCARLTVEKRSEQRFYSDIVSNKIVSEKSSTRPDRVPEIMRSKVSHFLDLSDPGILSIISGCYGITKKVRIRRKKKDSRPVLPLIFMFAAFISLIIVIICGINC